MTLVASGGRSVDNLVVVCPIVGLSWAKPGLCAERKGISCAEQPSREGGGRLRGVRPSPGRPALRELLPRGKDRPGIFRLQFRALCILRCHSEWSVLPSCYLVCECRYREKLYDFPYSLCANYRYIVHNHIYCHEISYGHITASV